MTKRADKTPHDEKPAGAARTRWVVGAAAAIGLAATSFALGFAANGMVGDTSDNAAEVAATEPERSSNDGSVDSGATVERRTSSDEPPRPQRRPQSRQSASAPPVEAEPQVVNLGAVQRNQTLPVSTTVRNTSDEPIRIARSSANCGCTTADLSGTVIPAGEAVDIEAQFDTQTRVGPKTSTITLAFAEYARPVQIQIRADVQ